MVSILGIGGSCYTLYIAFFEHPYYTYDIAWHCHMCLINKFMYLKFRTRARRRRRMLLRFRWNLRKYLLVVTQILANPIQKSWDQISDGIESLVLWCYAEQSLVWNLIIWDLTENTALGAKQPLPLQIWESVWTCILLGFDSVLP